MKSFIFLSISLMMFSCKPSSTVSDLASAQNTNNRTSSSNNASSTGSSSTSNANSSSTSNASNASNANSSSTGSSSTGSSSTGSSSTGSSSTGSSSTGNSSTGSSSTGSSSTGSSSTGSSSTSNTNYNDDKVIINNSTIPKDVINAINNKKESNPNFSDIKSQLYYLPIPVDSTEEALNAISKHITMNSFQENPGLNMLVPVKYVGYHASHFREKEVGSPVPFNPLTTQVRVDPSSTYLSIEFKDLSESETNDFLQVFFEDMSDFKCYSEEIQTAKKMYSVPNMTKFYLLFFQAFFIPDEVQTQNKTTVYLTPLNWNDLSKFGTYQKISDGSCFSAPSKNI